MTSSDTHPSTCHACVELTLEQQTLCNRTSYSKVWFKKKLRRKTSRPEVLRSLRLRCVTCCCCCCCCCQKWREGLYRKGMLSLPGCTSWVRTVFIRFLNSRLTRMHPSPNYMSAKDRTICPRNRSHRIRGPQGYPPHLHAPPLNTHLTKSPNPGPLSHTHTLKVRECARRCRGGIALDWIGLDWIGLDWIRKVPEPWPHVARGPRPGGSKKHLS